MGTGKEGVLMKCYSGLLVYLVGPSGAGKDSLLEAAKNYFVEGITPAGYPCVHFAKRYITRPSEASNETHIELTPLDFTVRSQKGDFVMEWHRHGLSYGIGREILAFLKQGGMVVMNGSREYAAQAFTRVAPILLVEVTVRPDVLRHRLELRGRENQQAIESRLRQAEINMPEFPHHARIDNSGHLKSAQDAFINLLNNTSAYLA